MKFCSGCPDVEFPSYPVGGLHAQIPVPFLPASTGAGDLVAQLAALVGARPCEACRRRQELLNRVRLTPWRTDGR